MNRLDFSNLKLLIFDVDGVLTNGKYIVDELGNIRKEFNVKDIEALRYLKQFFNILFISGCNKVNPKVAKILNIPFILERKDKKARILKLLRERFNLTVNSVLFVGDDLSDIKAARLIPMSFCPKDAIPEIKNIAKVMRSRGGDGIAMELKYMLEPEILRRKKLGLI